MANQKPEGFFDINKLPAMDGLILFPISMLRISNAQNGEAYFEHVEHLTKKIAKPALGAVFIYTDHLYAKYHTDKNSSQHKYLDLVITHKNLFLKNLNRKSKYVERAFSFLTWMQLCIESKNYLQMLKEVHDLYEKDEEFAEAVKEDIKASGRKLARNHVDFVIEETLMCYLLLRDAFPLQNEFVNGREKFRLLCYPGKPNRSFICFFKKDILRLASTNPFQNHMYDLEQRKLYDFTRMEP